MEQLGQTYLNRSPQRNILQKCERIFAKGKHAGMKLEIKQPRQIIRGRRGHEKFTHFDPRPHSRHHLVHFVSSLARREFATSAEVLPPGHTSHSVGFRNHGVIHVTIGPGSYLECIHAVLHNSAAWHRRSTKRKANQFQLNENNSEIVSFPFISLRLSEISVHSHRRRHENRKKI